MTNPFFERPILNSPYTRPARHWELDASGQPTQKILESRRRADFFTPIPNRCHINWIILDSAWEAEFRDVYMIEADFKARVEAEFDGMVQKAIQ